MKNIGNVVLLVQPGIEPMSWQEFISTTPPFSIALDGYVSAGPIFQKITEGGPRQNFNHHEGVDRLSTRATCAQVLMALRMRLFDTFRTEDGPNAQIYVGDCDQDVCVAWFILHHGWMCDMAINPLLNKLVDMEDKLDTTAGAYPFPKDLPLLRTIAWIFKPYSDLRCNGNIQLRDPDQFKDVITSVEDRIMRFINGDAGEVQLDFRYKVIGGGAEWKMVQEEGAHARAAMLDDKIYAFVAVRPRADGRFNYTLGRMSVFVPFDIDEIVHALNDAEGTPQELWGGANTIAGSPRVTGSRLAPTEVELIIKDYLRTTSI